MKTSFGSHSRKNTLKLAALAMIPASMLVLNSCSSTKERGGSEGETMQVPTRVETYERTATVTAIDPATRRITLTAPDGMQTTIKAGPEVRNFDQIRVGDQVRATMTQAMAVSLHPPGMAPSAAETATIAVAPKGAKPAAVMTETAQVTAKILAIDRKNRTATLQYPDGGTRTIKVAEDVNLDRVIPGQEVTARLTESMAIQVEKP